MPHTVIRASAGAGKTYELTSRYIDLLRQGHPAAGILATTFTRKAAGEILGRLLSRLAHAASDAGGAAALATDLEDPTLSTRRCGELLADVCRSLHSVSICTIDSFFARMARCFHHELDVPLAATVIGEGDAAAVQLRAAAIDAMLADADLPVLLDLMQRLCHDSAQRGVTNFIDRQVSGLYDLYRQAPEAALWSKLTVPRGLDAAAFDEVLAVLRRLHDDAEANWGKALAKALAGAIGAIEHRDWQAFLSKGLGGALAQGKDTFSRKPIPAELAEALAPFLACADADLIGEAARRTEALHDLLHRFDSHYANLRQLHRVLLFSDLPHKLAQTLPTLGDDALAEVYYRLDTRVAHLMLDEFQDTSNQQWQILRPFAEEITAHADGSRSFFCVGDTKQAIYGWRGGCAELFDQLQGDLHLPGEAIRRRHISYRSAQVVLDAVNQVFVNIDQSPVLAAHADVAAQWRQRFEPHEAHFQKAGYVELITSPGDDPDAAGDSEPDHADGDDDGPSAADLRSNHVHFSANHIAQLAHDFPGRSIGVLVGTNALVARLIEILQQEHALAVSGEGGSPVTDDPAVAAVLAALTLADHPGNTAAAFHVLNSPLGRVVGLEHAAAAHVADVALSIRAALLARGYGPVLGGWAQQLAGDCKRRSVIRLTQLVELADRYDPDLSLRPGDFVNFARHTPVEEPTPAPVRVMTVHKAKGLEFDIVVLPDLTRKLGRLGDRAVYIEREQPTAPISAVYAGANQFVRGRSPQLQRAHDQELARRLNDDLSALYVAMTRARHALHMIVPPLQPKKDGSARSIGICYAAILRNALGRDDEQLDSPQSLYEHGDPAWARPTVPPDVAEPAPPVPAEASWAPPAALADLPTGPKRSWPRLSPSAAASAERVAAADLLELTPAWATVRGVVIHAWFEQVEWSKTPLCADDALLAIGRRNAPLATDNWLQRQLEDFGRMLLDPQVVAALSPPTGAPGERLDLWRERPFALRLGAHLVTGRFDRVVVVRGAAGRALRAELIDFKTDRVDAESLQEVVAEYGPQIDTYRRALGAMLGLAESAVTGNLLFVQSGRCVAV